MGHLLFSTVSEASRRCTDYYPRSAPISRMKLVSNTTQIGSFLLLKPGQKVIYGNESVCFTLFSELWRDSSSVVGGVGLIEK